MRRVAIDCRMIRHSGIGTYLSNLLRSRAYSASGLELLLLGDADRLSGLPGRAAPYPPPIYSLREQWAVRTAFRGSGWDLFHAPHYNLPLACPTPVVVTVHDMIHWRFPEFLSSRAARLYARGFFRWGIRKAARVIADSECTKRDLVELARLPEGRIVVIPLGVSPLFRPLPEDEVAAFLRRFGLPRRYLLYVGNVRPLKNLACLVESFWAAADRLGDRTRLLIAGRDFMPEWSRSVASDSVRFLGEVPFDHLPFLYSGAAAFVSPSLYEGFGLPPLEAMASGCPVIASRAGALPEILGDAACTFDPRSPAELTRAILRVVGDPETSRELACRGLARAAEFPWERTAERTLALYGSLLA